MSRTRRARLALAMVTALSGAGACGGEPDAGATATGGASTASGGAPTSSTGGSSQSGAGATSLGGATTGGVASGGMTPLGGVAGAPGGMGGTGSGGAPAGGAATSGGAAETGGASGGAPAGGAGTAGSAGMGGTTGGAGGTDGGSSGAGAGGTGLDTPSCESVVDAMTRANAWFMDRHPDPGADAPGGRDSNLWTRAVYYEGLMALHAISPSAAYRDYAIAWGEAHAWNLRDGNDTTVDADNQCAGQTYVDLYLLDGSQNAERLAHIQNSIDGMLDGSDDDAWTWIDAIQMSMPVFARFGVLLDDSRYFDKMWDLYSHTRNTEGGGLFNSADGLFWRDGRYSPGGTMQTLSSTLNAPANFPGTGTNTYIVSPNGEDIYWSRGNGWVMAALARVLDVMPADGAHRADYVADLTAMAQGLLPLQRTDGFWNESLTDPTHCSSIDHSGEDGPEASGTALFAYGLAFGVRAGLLEPDPYGAAALEAWDGLTTVALQQNGLLGYVQSTGNRPCQGESDDPGLGATTVPNFDDFGVGCFLLAGSEIARLAGCMAP